jgi:hypothetical protein
MVFLLCCAEIRIYCLSVFPLAKLFLFPCVLLEFFGLCMSTFPDFYLFRYYHITLYLYYRRNYCLTQKSDNWLWDPELVSKDRNKPTWYSNTNNADLKRKKIFITSSKMYFIQEGKEDLKLSRWWKSLSRWERDKEDILCWPQRDSCCSSLWRSGMMAPLRTALSKPFPGYWQCNSLRKDTSHCQESSQDKGWRRSFYIHNRLWR